MESRQSIVSLQLGSVDHSFLFTPIKCIFCISPRIKTSELAEINHNRLRKISAFTPTHASGPTPTSETFPRGTPSISNDFAYNTYFVRSVYIGMCANHSYFVYPGFNPPSSQATSLEDGKRCSWWSPEVNKTTSWRKKEDLFQFTYRHRSNLRHPLPIISRTHRLVNLKLSQEAWIDIIMRRENWYEVQEQLDWNCGRKYQKYIPHAHSGKQGKEHPNANTSLKPP
ncbi:hypothetical protein ACRALDRAFT_2017984 [Sodiomyces alcalophilus JCM 7366]|uniref:uncharacterized protein n=1 Tax=Sodiomyces alcalophilus JCM 7366 TaxID=591952 RepID=UPI0039B464E9